MKVKTILVSQPKPASDKSPYFSLAEKYKLKIDFRPFVHIEGVPAKEFKSFKVNMDDFTAIILTSRNAVDHFFRICEELKIAISSDWKYFCISESTALYLQKYITYRKRKVFIGKQVFSDLLPLIIKHEDERFLLPCSDMLKGSIPEKLGANNVSYEKAVLYRTVASDLSDLENVKYDMLVFFSPTGIHSLFKNFPEFKQDKTLIACYGPTTTKAAEDYGLVVNIPAPQPEAPSMTMAIEGYVKK